MTAPAEWVELSELVCPGCREQVRAESPPGELGEGWSHRDGSPLCHARAAAPGEPIEWRATQTGTRADRL